MKTPKRDIMPLSQLEGGHRLYKGKEHEYFGLGFFPATASRWKRKNREAQYKRTIARLTEENKHLRTALAIRTIHDINENNIESLKFIQQHLTVETFQPQIEREGDRNWMFKWKRPIPRWNNSIIDLHLPEDEQP